MRPKKVIEMPIEKCLTLSTGHVKCNEHGEPQFGNIRDQPHEHGWIVFVCDDAELTDWFQPIHDAALKEGCTLVNFDSDADYGDFKVFDD